MIPLKGNSMLRYFAALALLFLLLTLGLKAAGRLLYPLPNSKLIYYYADINNIDPYLLAAVIKTESNFNSMAESPKGARGLMQIMPETAEWVSRQMGDNNFQPYMLYMPEANIKIGSWYMQNLLQEFNGDVILMLAAYNGGRGNVKKWLASRNWTGEQRTLDQIPYRETREFVRKVLWTQKIYRHLYGS